MSSEGPPLSTSPKHVICSAWLRCLPMFWQMLRFCSHKNDLAIAQWGAFDIVTSIAQQLYNSTVQPLSMSIMTSMQTCAIVTNLNFLVCGCCTLYALSGVSPASAPPCQTARVMLANKHTRNAHLLCDHSDHLTRGVPSQDSFVLKNDESIPKQEWIPGTQTSRGELFQKIPPVPSSIILYTPPPRPPSSGHFTP
ncbi:hypothetical protein O181_034263 [Austropuccinia psidii MF-1]|uniref:Uncharacterized protein n=1 Tax=Austropuccinia psidii MF-1 TaxID=1389203 RepID=A0A9Q3D545_9BASI|nr:hypothetical protein [Austropuccinia psidii MF-1]